MIITNKEVESVKLLKLLRRRKLPKVDTVEQAGKIATKFLIKYYGLAGTFEINCGYCFIWAYLVWALLPYQVYFITSDDHVVISHKNLFYDADNLEGYEDLSDLGIYNHTKFVAADVRGMAWYWTRAGNARKRFRTILRITFRPLYDYVVTEGVLPITVNPICVSITDIP